ncbi:SH3 domain-containing protein [Legionella fallonii]|uniref:Peptidase n=1 Tax=Legionella fallonii LLAP-10 TaxID=1212491 RepID=A0A098G0T5_9GAMM|nr:SH3 domain-containing protein [Legionella fallonii]CEG55574.1 peptidase [Legionella fallonii LLAP-10]
MNYTICDKRHLTKFIIAPFLFLYFSACFAMEVPIYDFPIIYSQNANDYLSPDGEDYNKNLLGPEYQNLQLKQFYNHYYSTDAQGLSPWSAQMVTSALPLMKKIEIEILEDFNNQKKSNEDKHYAENFKEHDQTWWSRIRDNMDLYALASSEFKEENRAISVANTYARGLPDNAPDFFHASLPGQGFPFDNLQESAIWAGTPLYIFSVSKDKAWSLVLTPDGYFAWVKSNDIAYVSSGFINQWQTAAQHSLIAVTQTEASIIDDQQQFQFTGYVGSVFPMIERNSQQTSILIPAKNSHNQAMIKTGIINTNASDIMPLTASPKSLVKIINQLKNRPYGWGGAFFFNDCSQEMKSIFTPFGIWLPRNSAQQAQLSSTLDLSKNNVDERISLLKEKGHPLMTIIYIGGHVMLYVGKKDINNNKEAAITYQNVWGMSPENNDKRYVIGQSLFFPLLKHYPENPDVSSLADEPNFKLIYLDELNLKADSPHGFANRFLEQRNIQN